MKILYRVIAALAALLIIPALWFLKMINFAIETPIGIIADSFSLDEIYKMIQDFDFGSKEFHISENLATVIAPLKAPAVTTLVFVVLMLLMVIAVFICSAFTNARKLNLIFSVTGAVSTIGVMASFSKLTSLITDGPVGLDKIINALAADSNSSIIKLITFFIGGIGDAVNSVLRLLTLQLTDGTVAALFIFIFIALWTTAFILIDLDENKLPKQKKQHNNKKRPQKKHN